MKVKMFRLANSINSLKFLSEQVLPAKVSYKIARMINHVSGELDVLEQTRKKLITQYKLENEQDQTPENIKAFQDEMTSILEEEIEIPFEPIIITELGPVHLSVNHLMNLDFMFKE